MDESEIDRMLASLGLDVPDPDASDEEESDDGDWFEEGIDEQLFKGPRRFRWDDE